MSILFPQGGVPNQASQTHQITTHNFANSRFMEPSGTQFGTNKHKALLNIEVYESHVRDMVVRFCGWHPNTLPRSAEPGKDQRTY